MVFHDITFTFQTCFQQSRVKQTATMVKPYLNNESAVNAVEELELVAMNVTASSNSQRPQPQLQPEHPHPHPHPQSQSPSTPTYS